MIPAMHPITHWRLNHPNGRVTCVELGKLLGVSEPEISRWENGLRRIPPERCKAIFAVTGIPRSVLRPDIFGEEAEAA
jgi:DNA-binding transcriptional regulator YdaS (Cro superfamily)